MVLRMVDFEPKIGAFACNWPTYAGADVARWIVASEVERLKRGPR
jgi:coenzyme F420-reducing hydrogenase delta subunit